jgi:glucose dehydrogenase
MSLEGERLQSPKEIVFCARAAEIKIGKCTMRKLAGAIVVLTIATLASAMKAEERRGFVDDARLSHAASADGDWITFGRDYTNQRFSPLDKINRSNVTGFVPAWTYQLGTAGSTQTHPIVVGGVMYVTTPGNHVAAINAATGEEIWRYTHVPRRALPAIPSNRGAAVAYNLVFEATDDAWVIALDQATGKVSLGSGNTTFRSVSIARAGEGEAGHSIQPASSPAGLRRQGHCRQHRFRGEPVRQ